MIRSMMLLHIPAILVFPLFAWDVSLILVNNEERSDRGLEMWLGKYKTWVKTKKHTKNKNEVKNKQEADKQNIPSTS